MNTDETLSGRTAGFVAAIANALGRNISGERMDELLHDNEKLKLLLLPLVSEDWLPMIPAIGLFTGRLPRDIGEIVSFTLTGTSSINKPTMRTIMKEAGGRKFAPLSRMVALSMAEKLIVRDRISIPTCIFPHVHIGELWVLKVMNRKITRIKVDLDEIDESLMGVPVFFKKGFSDGSDCPTY